MEVQYPAPPSLDAARAQNGSPFMSGFQRILFAHNPEASLPSIDDTAAARHLPQRDVTDDTLDDAYAKFILYCNPAIPFDTDCEELRRNFRSPPKSDGKSFSTFTLFELIRKLELKEIKTWAQLAKDLGVDPPAFDKGQSAQKVQQYAVRLKRWMRAMHVDAFFEYLQDKPHVYWTQIPLADEPPSEFGRDGVPPEEDLALRALLPETRPKRGRRKAEDKDDDIDSGKSPAQRPRIDSPVLSDDFAMARPSLSGDSSGQSLGHRGFTSSFEDKIAPWSALEPKSSVTGTFRWPPPENLQTPLSAYPQSAVTPSNRTLLWNDADEPRSAITPSKARYRRRHGPAVSSAWSSKGTSSSGKLRGRPPSNRSVTDGPFSTFPANPMGREVPTIQLDDNTPASTPIVKKVQTRHFFPPIPESRGPQPPGPPLRPSRLQLQVPQREGGSVRLATPPPVVLVRGENDKPAEHTAPSHAQSNTQISVDPKIAEGPTPKSRHSNPDTAFRDIEDTDRTNVDALEHQFVSELLSAQWYDGSGASTNRCSYEEADKICSRIIKNLQAESVTAEEFLINLSALAGSPLKIGLRVTKRPQVAGMEYECHWKMRFGSAERGFTKKVVIESTDDANEDMLADKGLGEATGDMWKRRYLELQREVRSKDERFSKFKKGLLNVLLESETTSRI